jgi:heme/copper-type cytochrome/quinol oxidase subunit 2
MQRGRPRSMLGRTEGGIAMGVLWTIVTFLFTLGVLGLVLYALVHLRSAARDNSPRTQH